MNKKLLVVPALALCLGATMSTNVWAGGGLDCTKVTTSGDLAECLSDGADTTLNSDITGSVLITESLTLDLNGKTLDGSISVKNGAKVTITGNGYVGDTKDGKVYAVGEGTEVTIKNGTFKSTDTGNVALIHAVEKAKITIEDGTFTAAKGGTKEGKVFYSGSNSGTEEYREKYGYIVITGGNFTGRMSNSNWGKYSISGGTFDRNAVAFYTEPSPLAASWPLNTEEATLADAGWLVEGYALTKNTTSTWGVVYVKDLEDAITDAQEIIDAENAREDKVYTVGSMNSLKQTKITSKSILDNAVLNETGNQDDIDTQAELLQKAIEELVDISDLKAAYETASEGLEELLEVGEYSKKSLDNLKKAIEEMGDVVENENATKKEVEEAGNNYANALDDLVVLTALKEAIEKAQGRINHSEKYTDDSMLELSIALGAGQALYEDEELCGEEDQELVDEMVEELNEAYENAEKRVSVKSLKDIYDRVMEKIEAEELYVSGGTALDTAIKAAEEILEEASNLADTEENRQAVDDAASALRSAYMHTKINSEAIEEILDLLDEIDEEYDPEDYTRESVQAVQDVIDDLLDYIFDLDRDISEEDMKKDLEEFEEELIEALANLVEAGDFTKLDEAIEKASGVDTEGYTAESVEDFEEALEVAKIVREMDLSNSEEDQGIIDEATELLLEAIAALIKAPETGSLTQTSENALVSSNVIFAVMAGVAVAGYAGTKLLRKK